VTDAVQLVAIATSLLLLAVVLELVRRRKLTEEYSFIWLTCAAAMLVLSIWRDILHVAARALEVHYPPALLLLVLILFAFAASLYFSIVVSRQRQQIERLMEEVALLDAEIRESAARGVGPASRPGLAEDPESARRDAGTRGGLRIPVALTPGDGSPTPTRSPIGDHDG
jgi:hypothetical protein